MEYGSPLRLPRATQAPKRLFVALRFSADERAMLAQTRDGVLARLCAGRPTPTENIHLTLAFLGMLDTSGEQRAKEALGVAADACGPVSLSLGPLGVFEHRSGGIVWRSVSREVGLLRLQRILMRELSRLELPVGEKPFVPHVTLVRGAHPARNERCGITPDLQRVCDELSSGLPPLETRHAGVALMWSHHPEGSKLTYTPSLTMPLRGGEADGAEPRNPNG